MFEKSLWPSPDERGASRDDDEGFGNRRELLVVASEAAVLHDPGEGSLDNPAPWQHLEAFGSGVSANDLLDDMGLVLRPGAEAARIAAVGIDPAVPGKDPEQRRSHAERCGAQREPWSTHHALKMEAPSFEGLRPALRTADTRIRFEDEFPSIVPIVHGVQFQGAFLDGEAIRFSPNLTCIIGGRGSGKSTAFESICLLGGPPSPDVTAIDRDVWPETVSLAYRDQTAETHSLARSKLGEIENLDRPGKRNMRVPPRELQAGRNKRY